MHDKEWLLSLSWDSQINTDHDVSTFRNMQESCTTRQTDSSLRVVKSEICSKKKSIRLTSKSYYEKKSIWSSTCFMIWCFTDIEKSDVVWISSRLKVSWLIFSDDFRRVKWCSRNKSDSESYSFWLKVRSCNTFESNIDENLTISTDEDMLLSDEQHWINVKARREIERQMIQEQFKCKESHERLMLT